MNRPWLIPLVPPRSMLRRDLLKQSTVGLPALAPGLSRSTAPGTAAGTSEPFDEARLLARARALVTRPYRPRSMQLPKPLAMLGWGDYQPAGHRLGRALWVGQHLLLEARFFHLGLFFKSAVQMHEVVDGHACLIAYDPAMFDYDQSGLARQVLPADSGFAGFRPTTKADPTRDVATFLGANYFCTVGGQWQYGMSAYGPAIGTGLPRAEEFSDFIEFWLMRPAVDADTVRAYALLDSLSVASIYRLDIRPDDTLAMDMAATLYVRKPIERPGTAPPTSIFLYGENDRTDRAGNRHSATRRWRALDWRPEIHNSDGLAIWRGSDEWTWRPLANPSVPRSQRFADDSPRGFGLLQRDCNPDHYQDDGMFYEERPSVRVESMHDWGKGAVGLVELSANGETFDNIVTFWRPAAAPHAGWELALGYQPTWSAQPAAALSLARVVATRTGAGDVVGQPRKYFSWRFVVNFADGELSRLRRSTVGSTVEPIICASRGRMKTAPTQPLANIDSARTMFGVVPDASNASVELLLTLQSGGRLLSEIWVYQWAPPVDRGA